MSSSEGTQWPVIGHEWAVAQLARALHYGRTRHAYLFTGPEQIGKTTLAHTFAAALNCTGPTPPCGQCRACTLIARNGHPDLTVVEAETAGGSLKIDQVRALQQTLALRPFEARYRVAILLDFHLANPAAANALLKTLEEPSPGVVLLLTATSADLLLPTIVSRCQLLHLHPLPIQTVRAALEQHFAADPETAQMLAQLSGGRIGWAIRALTDPAALDQRQEALATLDSILAANRRERFALAERLALGKSGLLDVLTIWQGFWRDVLLVASGSRAPITNYDRAGQIAALAQAAGRDQAERALAATTRTLDFLGKNANTRLTLDVLVLDYPSA